MSRTRQFQPNRWKNSVQHTEDACLRVGPQGTGKLAQNSTTPSDSSMQLCLVAWLRGAGETSYKTQVAIVLVRAAGQRSFSVCRPQHATASSFVDTSHITKEWATVQATL